MPINTPVLTDEQVLQASFQVTLDIFVTASLGDEDEPNVLDASAEVHEIDLMGDWFVDSDAEVPIDCLDDIAARIAEKLTGNVPGL